MLGPPDWGWGSDEKQPKSVAPVLAAPRNELPVNKFSEACSIHDGTSKDEQPACQSHGRASLLGKGHRGRSGWPELIFFEE